MTYKEELIDLIANGRINFASAEKDDVDPRIYIENNCTESECKMILTNIHTTGVSDVHLLKVKESKTMETNNRTIKLFIGPRASGKTTSCTLESHFTNVPILQFNCDEYKNRAKELNIDSPPVIRFRDLHKLSCKDTIIVDEAIELLKFLLHRHYSFKGTISAASITSSDV